MSDQHLAEILDAWQCTAPKVTIDPETWCDILNAVRFCPIELSWFSKVALSPAGCHLSGIIIPPQDCSLSHTDIFGEALQDMLTHVRAIGEDPAAYACWGHSHVRGAAYMSGTDHRAMHMMHRYLLNGDPSPIIGPWVSIVVNVHAHARCWVNMARPALWRGDLPLEVHPRLSLAAMQQLAQTRRASIQEAVRQNIQQQSDPRTREEKRHDP